MKNLEGTQSEVEQQRLALEQKSNAINAAKALFEQLRPVVDGLGDRLEGEEWSS